MDVEDPMLVETKKVKQYIAAICVSLGAVCTGSVLAWTSPVIPQLEEQNILTEAQSGIVGSMVPFGALVAALPAGYLAEKYGRTKTILGLVIPFLINWVLILLNNGPFMLYVARFFAGIAAGAMCVCAPMYIGEISQASIRGSLGSFFQMFICAGILSSYLLGAFLNWFWMSFVLASFPFIFAACFYFMPETPVYLVKQGLMGRAEEVLKYFRGEQYKNAERELLEINSYIKESQEKTSNLRDLFTSKANRKAVLSGVGIMFFQQFSGINAVIFYTGAIFGSASDAISPDLSSIIVGIVQLISAYVSVMIIERANRKFYLKLSSVGMAVCLMSLGLYFHLTHSKVTFAGLGILPLASIVFYIIFFSMGFGPVPWMIMSELFAPEIKALATGLAVMTNWLCAFAVTLTFPILNVQLGAHVTFYLFCAIMNIGTIFVQLVIPETKGKSLKEIQEILNR
ncbi:facilitated trehalose transporter Tret1-like [Onthophagus taurus]|uniref:facilitated trehalose transporter Tret1-like n=1 Tax=Onthophagus taurus TaxID=166361 RepID=UPI000C206EDF|nr:facilitated trehalose transporter Tret1-like [Onthophagus taurus]